MQKPLGNRISIISFFLVLAFGCGRKNVDSAFQVLIPPGGTGSKTYCYDSGEQMQVTHWRNGSLIRNQYFEKDGTCIFDCRANAGRSLLLRLDQEGRVVSVSDSVNLKPVGVEVHFEPAKIKAMIDWDLEIRK